MFAEYQILCAKFYVFSRTVSGDICSNLAVTHAVPNSVDRVVNVRVQVYGKVVDGVD